MPVRYLTELPFNKLSHAEAERLAVLSGELGELQQVIGKILQHGYESRDPVITGSMTNREHLELEMGDVRGEFIRMCDAGDVAKSVIHTRADGRVKRSAPFMHHQDVKP